MVYPGTRAFNWAKENDFLTTTNYAEWLNPDGTHNSIVSTDKLTNKELVDACDEARMDYYARPKFLTQKIIQGITNPKEFPRLFKSGKTFLKYWLNRYPNKEIKKMENAYDN